VTHRRLLQGGRQFDWQSRAHRKGLARLFPATMPDHWSGARLNPWIGGGFAIGSLLFVIGSILTMIPDVARVLEMSVRAVNTVYFIGSVFFTLAGYLQVLQSANAGDISGRAHTRLILIGWKPDDIGWLSSFLQFLGTLLFNLSTVMAIFGSNVWWRQDLSIWGPDVFGSVLFLLAGYLAFIETCHRHWAWLPGNLAWRVVFINLLGSIAFMISAIFAFVPASGAGSTALSLSIVFTLLGAVGFLIGALLMLAEEATEQAQS
jgi:hypothetical protein